MAVSGDDQVQRSHAFAIVDEVDSILIDEARTPLIISGRADDAQELYVQFAAIVKGLKREQDYEVDEAKRTVVPTERGVEAVEKALAVDNLTRTSTRTSSTSSGCVGGQGAVQERRRLRRARVARSRSSTSSPGGSSKAGGGPKVSTRRRSEGAVRSKRKNRPSPRSRSRTTFRMYDKLSGMTGTASTEAGEFAHTYGLEVVSIPTNQAMIRIDEPDLIYKTEAAKFEAAADDIAERARRGQPVLVGTISVEKSEQVSRLLEKRASSTGCSTPSSTSGRRTWSPRPVASVRSPSPPTWRARVDILLGGNPEGLAQQELLASGTTVEESPEKYAELVEQLKVECAQHGPTCAGWAVSTSSVPSATRAAGSTTSYGPFGPAGRPRRDPLLPLPRRRAHAPVRHRRDELGDGQGVPRRHAARGQDGHQGHRARAADGRGPQLRDPQGRPQVRRGDERAAEGDLPPPPADLDGGDLRDEAYDAITATIERTVLTNCPTSTPKTGISTSCICR